MDSDGTHRGVVTTASALEAAADAGLDLVEVSPQADPPVCKIMDHGRAKYLASKQRQSAQRQRASPSTKEITLRAEIASHDYEVKLRRARAFLAARHKVKVSVRVRRRMAQPARVAMDLLRRMELALAEHGVVEAAPFHAGRGDYSLVLRPT